MSTPVPVVLEHPIHKLTKDLKAATLMLTVPEVRYLVDTYYNIQEWRKASNNQLKALEKSGEPNAVIRWLLENSEELEEEIKKALGLFARSQKIGQWAESIIGIGPVINAGLQAHIDIEKAPHAGNIWSFAGMNPTKIWNKGEKRPFNASLKVLCWKIGQSFLKQSNKEDCLYGQLLKKRWAWEWQQNLEGVLVEQAAAKLEKFNIDKKRDAYLWYSGKFAPAVVRAFRANEIEFAVGMVRHLPTIDETELLKDGMENEKMKRFRTALKAAGFENPEDVPIAGAAMLPPAHILARACRWAVKLFLSHWHEVAYELHYGKKPPVPYVLEPKFGGHADRYAVPNWPLE